MSEITLENARKAMQRTDLLLQDLQQLNRSGSSLVSLLTLPEIEKVACMQARLGALILAIKHSSEPSSEPVQPCP